jgi:hypothetical protein
MLAWAEGGDQMANAVEAIRSLAQDQMPLCSARCSASISSGVFHDPLRDVSNATDAIPDRVPSAHRPRFR